MVVVVVVVVLHCSSCFVRSKKQTNALQSLIAEQRIFTTQHICSDDGLSALVLLPFALLLYLLGSLFYFYLNML